MNKKIIVQVLILFLILFNVNVFANNHETTYTKKEYKSKTLGELATSFYETTGIKALLNASDNVYTDEPNPANARKMTAFEQTWGRSIMFIIVGILFYLAIAKGFEPLLLLPIALADYWQIFH